MAARLPSIGSATLDTYDGSLSVTVIYNNDGTNGFLQSSDLKFKLTVDCSGKNKSIDLVVRDSGTTTVSTNTNTPNVPTNTSSPNSQCPNSGTVIFDMTASSGSFALQSNLSLLTCANKSDTAIDDGIGSNAINSDDFHVMYRDYTGDPIIDGDLKLVVGSNAQTSQSNLIDTNSLTYFKNGQHLFDLDRLRNAADWIKSHVTPDTGILSRQYGTITLSEFLQNISENKTMYGIVRVKIPLEIGQCTNNASCSKNALNDVVLPSDLYGFCDTAIETGSLCICAPGNNNSANTFTKIKEGLTLCGHTLPANAQINVKGSLIWDFVAAQDDIINGLNQGDPIPLSLLPLVPRELYFKVEIPINVNAAYDLNNDGIMDNMSTIANYNAAFTSAQFIQPTFSYSTVPPESKAAYLYQFGTPLTQTLFDQLDNASKYHMMSANGYPSGWAEAFNKLNITGNDWTSMSFGISSAVANNVISENDVRSNSFEDIPTYLYTGGLIDMHDHCNISGLVYVPQGMELEAKSGNNAQQYFSGAILVRDTYYLQINGATTMQLISSESQNFSNSKVNNSTTLGLLSFDSLMFVQHPVTNPTVTKTVSQSNVGTATPLESVPSSPCFSCANVVQANDPVGGGAGVAGSHARNWVEIVPQ
ncbi:MAG: hypothetical protein Q9N32_00935 [Gammaproteobacteria bacterium]|nr:hypothetical protein [Gammaproteobacteria bacterium]